MGKRILPELIYCAGGNRRFSEIAIHHGFTYGSQLPCTVYYPIEFADQDWKNPIREKYMDALKEHRPRLATVLDLEDESQFDEVMSWAEEASGYVTEAVLIIPKYVGVIDRIPESINGVNIRLAYSVSTGGNTQYAQGTVVPYSEFGNRPTHLLGGSPQKQYSLYQKLGNVVSADGNYVQKMAVRFNQFFSSGSMLNARNRRFPQLSESVYGHIDKDAPYFAFGLSCMNIKAYWNGCSATIRYAVEGDISRIKNISNQYSKELGFVMIPALKESIVRNNLYVAEIDGRVVGFVNFRLRKDGKITIYEIATDKEYRRPSGMGFNIGTGLIASLPNAEITLKCTTDNSANEFYSRIGFSLIETIQGRKRPLNVWRKGKKQ